MKTRILLASLALLIIVGCKSESTEKNDITIDVYANNLQVDVSVDKYILLDTCQLALFNNIDKIRYNNGNFYIYDFASSKILRFDNDGKFINQVGRIGRANNEYIRATSFAVDNGTISVIDNQKDRILSYDKDGRFVKSIPLPYFVNSMELLPNDDMLFILNNNEGLSVDNKQIVVVDSNLGAEKIIRSYTGNEQCEFAPPSYIEDFDNGYIVNIPLSDDLYILDSNGEQVQTISFDFGKKSMPDNIRSSFYNLLEKIGEGVEYSYIMTTPIYFNNLIIAKVAEGGKSNTVIADIKHNKAIVLPFDRPDKYDITSINTPLCVYDDYLVTMLTSSLMNKSNAEYEELPADVRNHLENGYTVLCLLEINEN